MSTKWITTDDYFLSSINPIANADQVWVEKAVLRLLDREDVQAAIRQATFLWRAVSGTVSDEALAIIEPAIREYGVNYCIKAANSDANHPRIVQNWMLDHEWFGHRMPAARIGGDNPDNGYRLIPVEHGAHYRVEGQMLGKGPADVTWSIVANAGTSMTLASLEGCNIVCDAQGRFTVSIDDRPANGRPNHLQTKRGALFLFVRDSVGDWDREQPNALRVTRLTPPSAPPIDDDEMAWRAIDWMLRDVSLYYWFTMLSIGKPANTLVAPQGSGGVGGLRSQFGTYGLLRIADDEAFVLKVNPGGASFRNIVAHDWWFRSIEPNKRTGSLNNAQIEADDDGNFTFAVGPTDPGLHNWIDTGGLHETLLLHRWQGVAPDTPEAALPRLLSARLVKLSDLGSATVGAKRVTPTQRQQQIKTRMRQYAARVSV